VLSKHQPFSHAKSFQKNGTTVYLAATLFTVHNIKPPNVTSIRLACCSAAIINSAPSFPLFEQCIEGHTPRDIPLGLGFDFVRAVVRWTGSLLAAASHR
jgi:hypothetical protein